MYDISVDADYHAGELLLRIPRVLKVHGDEAEGEPVLIEVDVESEEDLNPVLKRIRDTDGVNEAHVVAGSYRSL